MAKFYARLVLIAAALIISTVLIVMYAPQSISDLQVPTDSQNSHVIEGGHNSTGKNIVLNTHVKNFQPGHITLATDAKDTAQYFSWTETEMSKNLCAKVNYTGIPLPQMSVVICFHSKETLSNLLHTIHGVFQRTPAHLLKEIILIDDYSRNADFDQILELYISAVLGGKVRIIRNTERLGLIRARLKGIQAATAEVVSVMDSHVEVQPGWAESLLQEIYTNPKTLAASYVDWMERKDGRWEYRHGGTTWKTYFDWTFVFGWQTMSQAEINARKSLIEPINAPVVIGTIYAIRKDYFFHVGAFDAGMELWGGENIDLPVRVWLCGGRVVNVPCSRAGHMETSGGRDYRLSPEWEISKYTNYRRFAEVWAGEFKKQFYYYTPEAAKVKEGDLSARIKFRSVCKKDFSWYLREIFPELGIPDRDGLAWGELKNEGSGKCLDTKNTLVPGQAPCGQGGGARQGAYWSKSLHLRFPIHILNYKNKQMLGTPAPGLYMDEYTSVYKTNRGSKYFHVKNGPIVEMQQKKCLDGTIPDTIQFLDCDRKSPFQMWHFAQYTQTYDDLLRKTSTEDIVKTSTTLYFDFLKEFSDIVVTLRETIPTRSPR